MAKLLGGEGNIWEAWEHGGRALKIRPESPEEQATPAIWHCHWRSGPLIRSTSSASVQGLQGLQGRAGQGRAGPQSLTHSLVTKSNHSAQKYKRESFYCPNLGVQDSIEPLSNRAAAPAGRNGKLHFSSWLSSSAMDYPWGTQQRERRPDIIGS
ncbi:hypothetical protein AXG93_4620s1960 [Marchantia polymorpha subsp. ruderalis]|uniref:Uncharacterized protein n=1 Tax=Marchantia polymorpha subsp. ruderalis TaxID=1480154 RepID=A0A176VYE1_MARPO|nr:hypothetical protein AXG93_4620s1960 [Marchantia polymorpha subsp. ruderalis]